jgi:hypothetical protein
MRTVDVTLSSFTSDKGVKLYAVSEGVTPTIPATPDIAVAIKAVATLTARLAARGITANLKRWDGDLGDYTNLYPDLSPVSPTVSR